MHSSLIWRFGVSLSGCLLCAALSWGAGDSRPPNVVLFLVSDLGWQDTSVPFLYDGNSPVLTPANQRLHTPNMERLARQGMKFTSAYACCVDSPSRVSLLTGLNAARHRVTSWVLHKDVKTDNTGKSTLLPPDWNCNGLSSEPATPHAICVPTLPQLLRQAGYRTILVGSSHWGALEVPAASPKNVGFDISLASEATNTQGSYLGERNYARKPGRHNEADVPGLEEYHGTHTFLTQALTNVADKAIADAVAAGQPFFLCLSHYAMQVSYARDDRFYQRYRDAGLDDVEAKYASMVEGVDKSLGDVLDTLDRTGVGLNTIVIFMSTNGALSAVYRGGVPNTQNAPLRSGKGSAYEGGIRVPMIVKWPGVVHGGSVCITPVIVDDFLPSIMEMVGAKARHVSTPPVDGVSFVPLLRADGHVVESTANRRLYWHYPNFWGIPGPGIEPFSAIRAGDWKLIYFYKGARCELYNLAADIGEQHNLVTVDRARAQDLVGELADWLRRTNAQMPIEKRTGKAVALPHLLETVGKAGMGSRP